LEKNGSRTEIIDRLVEDEGEKAPCVCIRKEMKYIA
jgi:hypothetical protein